MRIGHRSLMRVDGIGALSGLCWTPVLGSLLPLERDSRFRPSGSCTPASPAPFGASVLVHRLPLSCPRSSSRSFPLFGALFPLCLTWPVPDPFSCLGSHDTLLRADFSGHPILSSSPDLCSDTAPVCFLHGS